MIVEASLAIVRLKRHVRDRLLFAAVSDQRPAATRNDNDRLYRMSVPPQRNPWRSRFRSLAFAVGVGTSFYLVTSYALDRMRETRLRLSKERNAKELYVKELSLQADGILD